MVDLKEYLKETVEGVIAEVKVMLLETWLQTKPNPVPEAKMKDWSNLDRNHICVYVEYDGLTVTNQFMVPALQGYTKSNLKKFMDLNDLPPDTDNWKGSKVKLAVDKSGFLRVAL